MPKFTYPVVFILNSGTDEYFGFIPDLGILARADKLEDAYAQAESELFEYFKIAVQDDMLYPPPSSLGETIKKWDGYKVSLLSAVV